MNVELCCSTGCTVLIVLYCDTFRLLNSSRQSAGDVDNVHFLESVSADKSLWCRLNLSFKQLINYVLLSAAGEHTSLN